MNCEKKNHSLYIKWLISLGLALALYFIPMGEAVTPEIKRFVSITIGFIALVAFEVMPTLLISMVLPCCYMLAGIADATVALSPWTNTLMYLVAAGMIFSNVLNDCGLLRRIALWMIGKCGGTFNGLVYGLYFVCLAMACLSFVQAWLLMFTLAIALCKAMGYESGSKEALLLMTSSFCGALTSTVYTYNPAYVPLLDGAYKLIDPAMTCEWFHMYLYMLPYIPVCLLFLFILTKIYKSHEFTINGGMSYVTDELAKMGKISVDEKKAAVALIFLVLFLVTSTWHGLNALFGFIIAVAYLFLPGINVGKKEAVAKVNMGTIAFMVACMSIGTVGSNVGFDTLVSDIFGSFLSTSGTAASLYTLFGLGAAANFAMTPLAILTCLLNPVVQIAQNLGINPLGAIYTLLASVDFYILPYENAWALVFYGLGMMSFKDFVKTNLLRSLMLTVALGVLFMPWWMLLGIL